jgi:ubiquinone/menaquinone biosynthesis C-methylase UbiE
MNEKTFQAKDALKLDDPERLRWMPPQQAVALLGLAPGETIADIGAGTGYFALPFARAVLPAGKVWAVDLQPEMLELLKQKIEWESGCAEIVPLVGTAVATGLADGSCDAAFLGNVWHELDQRTVVLEEIRRILRPGGRLAILDWRRDVSRPPGPPVEHRIAAAETAAELTRHGWTAVQTNGAGSYSYMVVARPPGRPADLRDR